jgi:hypothetical protein
MKIGSIVRVDWADAYSQHSQVDISDVANWKPCPMVAVGVLLRSDKKVVILSMEICDDGSQYREIFLIPRCNIKKVTELLPR